MRILFFHPLTGHLWRGIERTAVTLASALVEEGHDVAILTLRSAHRALLDTLHPRVTVFAAPRYRYAAYPLAVPYHLAHLVWHRYDAVIVFFGGFGVGAALRLARRVRHPRVYLCPCYPVDLAPHRYAEIERYGMPEWGAGIWAAGNEVAAQAERRFARPVVALPQGVDTRRFAPDAVRGAEVRRGLGIPDGAPLLLTISALEPRKGVRQVLAALPAVRSRCPEAIYLIVGEGAAAGELRALATTLGVQDAVVMIDRHDRPEDLYRAADLFCLLSTGDADPMVIYEAMASGLPLVTSSGAPFSRILDETVALLLPDLRPAMVAEGLSALLLDDARRRAMGRVARRSATQRHGIASLAREVVARITADDAGSSDAARLPSADG